MNQPVFTTLGCSKLCWCLLHQHIRPTSHIVLSQKQLWHLATRCRYVEHVEEHCQLFHPWFGGRCCSVLSRCRPTVLCMSHNARYRPTLTPFNRPSSTIHVFISDVSGKTISGFAATIYVYRHGKELMLDFDANGQEWGDVPGDINGVVGITHYLYYNRRYNYFRFRFSTFVLPVKRDISHTSMGICNVRQR